MDQPTESLPLLDPDASPGRELLLSPRPHPAAGGEGFVAVAIFAAARLTSRHVRVLSTTAGAGGPRLSRTLPRVPPEALLHLDGDGLVRPGTFVTPGMVLAGRVRPRTALALSIEERRAEAARGEISAEEDASLRCPPGASGTVIEVRRSGGAGPDDPARVEVTLEAREPLRLGDVLQVDGAQALVGALVEDLEGDIAWPGLSGRHRVLKVATAESKLHARQIGPYSLVTRQPLAGKERFGGQRVGTPEIEALRCRGAVHILHELMTVKSDDVEGRMRLYESIVRGEPRAEPSVPHATRVVERELMALAFELDVAAPQLQLRLRSSDALRRVAPGVVTRAETVDHQTHQPIPGGLFCEQVFGDLSADERSSRLGRLELPAPLLHPWARPAVAALLDLSAEALAEVLDAARTPAGAPAEALSETGGAGLSRALEALDLVAMAEDGSARGQVARALLASGTPASALVYDTWPVLPPDLRPLVPLADGRWATSDLNDLYRRLINRSSRLRRLLELAAPSLILKNEYRELQRALDALVDNGRWEPPLHDGDGRPLVSLAGLIQSPRGHFATHLLGKQVDYSGIAHVLCSIEASPGRVRVPRPAARELFRPWIFGALERRGLAEGIKQAKALLDARAPEADAALEEVANGYPVVLFPAETATSPAPVAALEVELWDELALGLPAAAYAQLGAPRAAVIHVPCDPRAVHEARTRIGQVHLVPTEDPAEGWLARVALAEAVGPLLFDAALRGEVDPVRDWTAKLILGRPLD